MSLEQFYYIGELIGTILVIASLIFVAISLRQNSEMMRTSAASYWVDNSVRLRLFLVENQELSVAWHKSIVEPGSLEELERLQLIQFYRTVFSFWASMLSLYQRRLLGEDGWREVVFDAKLLCQRQIVRAAWAQHESAFNTDFRKFISAQMADNSE